MRRNAEFFGEQSLDLLYMARRLKDALRLEDLLTEYEIDYVVETGSYTGGLLFRRELAGAFFYVTPQELERSRNVLIQNKYKPYLES